MDMITWRNADLRGRQFDFETGNKLVGRLILLNEVKQHANFITENDKIQFRPIGFLNTKIILRKNEKYIGEINTGFFKPTIIRLKNNRTFKLTGNWLGRNLKWFDNHGIPVIEYSMATLQSRGKGFINISEFINKDEQEILIGAGIIAERHRIYRILMLIIVGSIAAYLEASIFR